MNKLVFSKHLLKELAQKAYEGKTFNELERECEEQGLSFSLESFIDEELPDAATTIACLSDQCPYAIQITEFDEEGANVFQTQLNGSVVSQFVDAVSCLAGRISKENASGVSFDAVYEAVCNAILHREYRSVAPIRVILKKEGIEIISAGSICGDFLVEDVENGMYEIRNPQLVKAFVSLGYAKGCGTGIQTMKKGYILDDIKPQYIVTANSVKTVLPSTKETGKTKEKKLAPNKQEQLVVEYVEINGSATDDEVKALLDVKATRAYIILQEMLKKGLLRQEGRGKTKRYLK